MLERAWQEIEDLPEGARHPALRVLLIESAWLRGDRPAAARQIELARRSPATLRFVRWGGDLAVWAARAGERLDPPPSAAAAVLQELDGDWRRAIVSWKALQAPYEAALAALPGDDGAAREALGTLRRLGATATAQAFMRERTLDGSGPVRGPRASTLAHPAGLTRREQHVLELLATGASNQEIAAELHLSERTVAHHVSAIIAKLGAANRIGAVAHARERGLLAT